MKLTQPHHFCIRKVLLSNYFNSQIAQLLLTHKFYHFHPGLHISFKYAQHNHLIA